MLKTATYAEQGVEGKARSAMKWTEVVSLIDGAGLAHVSTSSPHGVPHVAVVSAALEGDFVMIAMRRNSGKAQNLAVNPQIALMWQGNSAETYVWGSVELIEAQAEKSRVWNSGLFPYDMSVFFQKEDSPDWLVARVRPQRATAIVHGPGGLTRRIWVRS